MRKKLDRYPFRSSDILKRNQSRIKESPGGVLNNNLFDLETKYDDLVGFMPIKNYQSLFLQCDSTTLEYYEQFEMLTKYHYFDEDSCDDRLLQTWSENFNIQDSLHMMPYLNIMRNMIDRCHSFDNSLQLDLHLLLHLGLVLSENDSMIRCLGLDLLKNMIESYIRCNELFTNYKIRNLIMLNMMRKNVPLKELEILVVLLCEIQIKHRMLFGRDYFLPLMRTLGNFRSSIIKERMLFMLNHYITYDHGSVPDSIEIIKDTIVKPNCLTKNPISLIVLSALNRDKVLDENICETSVFKLYAYFMNYGRPLLKPYTMLILSKISSSRNSPCDQILEELEPSFIKFIVNFRNSRSQQHSNSLYSVIVNFSKYLSDEKVDEFYVPELVYFLVKVLISPFHSNCIVKSNSLNFFFMNILKNSKLKQRYLFILRAVQLALNNFSYFDTNVTALAQLFVTL